MAKVIESLKRNYPFLAAVLVIAIWHTQMELNHDGIWFRMQLDLMSYAEFIAERYQGWSSRVFVETGLLFFSRHMAAWRVVDTAMWGFLLYGFVCLLSGCRFKQCRVDCLYHELSVAFCMFLRAAAHIKKIVSRAGDKMAGGCFGHGFGAFSMQP